MRVIPLKRLFLKVAPGAAPPKLWPTATIALLDPPAVAASVNRRPSTVTFGAMTRMPWLRPVTATVASAPRAGLADTGVVGSLGETPALGPAIVIVRLTVTCVAV